MCVAEAGRAIERERAIEDVRDGDRNARVEFRHLRVSADDVKQLLHERLLVSTADGPARILEYRGEGKLGSFVRVIATRMLINLSGAQKKETPLEDDLLEALVDPREHSQLAHLKATYRRELKHAFAVAVEGLSYRQRNLLRYSFCDHLSLDAIGGMYGVNKSNVSRWLADARETLFGELRAAFQEKLRVKVRGLRAVAEGGRVAGLLRSRRLRTAVSHVVPAAALTKMSV